MNIPRSCPISGKSLEGFHGNRKVHPEVEKIRKDEANKKRHSKVKEINKLALSLDKTLENYYHCSNGKIAIEKSMLLGFVWDFMTKISPAKPPIFWIINYGYSFNSDKSKIVIHYGNTKL